MALPDYLATLVGEDGLSILPEGVGDGITAEYDADMSIPTAKIAEMEETLALLTSELQATKAANWDLLQTSAAGSADDESSDTSESEASSDPDNSENDADNGDDDIFGKADD